MNARWQLRLRAPAFWQQPPGLVARLLNPVATRYGDHVIWRMDQTGARAGVPVLCIGNFTLGGAGKTPLAMVIAELLRKAGEKPAFLTRGYGGSVRGPALVRTAGCSIAVIVMLRPHLYRGAKCRSRGTIIKRSPATKISTMAKQMARNVLLSAAVWARSIR